MKEITFGKQKLVIKEEWKTAFLATWIVGLLAHAYRFFNFLPIWDSMYNFYGVGSTFDLGRWFLPYVGQMASVFDMPWVNGALSLFYISLCMVLIVEIFEIKNKKLIVIASAVFVSFPTVVSTFAYMYTADAYMLAFFLSVLSVYLTLRFEKWGMLAGMVSLAFCMGIYQAYAATAIVLVLVYVVRQFLVLGMDFWEEVKKDLKYPVMLLGGGILYFLILKFTIWYYDMTLSNYQGVNRMGIMSRLEYKYALINTKEHFLTMLGFEHGFEPRTYTVIHTLILFVFAVTLVYLCVRNRLYRKTLSLLAAAACIVLFPIGAYIIYFSSPGVIYHTLMEMSVCFFYLLILLLLDSLEWEKRLPGLIKGCGLAAMCWLVYYNVLNCNIAYFNLNLSYHKSYAIAENILDRIENLKEFYPKAKDKVVIIGRYDCPTENVRVLVPDIMGISNDSFLNDSEHYINFWNNCFGVSFGIASFQDMEEIRETEEFRNMPVYPRKGSVKYIDDKIVVKLSEE